jgi:hypothetical protein
LRTGFAAPMHPFVLIQDTLVLEPLIDGRADMVCGPRVSSGHLNGGIILFGRSPLGYYARSPAYTSRANAPIFSMFRISFGHLGDAACLAFFTSIVCTLVLALENFFARPGFDNLQIHEGSQRTISVSRRAVFWQGENYEEFNVIGSKWRKSMILMASEPRYAS